jgi:hypothetical protein
MSDNSPATEAEILFPDREVTIGGEVITVREFGYAETVRLSARHAALLTRIADEYEATGGKVMDLRLIAYDHPESWLELLAQASGRPAEWIEGLSRADGDALAGALWAANLDFFCRRLWHRLAAQQSASGGSTPS